MLLKAVNFFYLKQIKPVHAAKGWHPMATAVMADHHSIWRHLYDRMHTAQKPKSSSLITLANKIQGGYEAKSPLEILDYVNSDWRIVAPKHCAHDYGSTQYFLFASSGMKFVHTGAQHIYIHVSRWQEEIRTSCFPLYKYLFPEKKSKRC